MTRRPWLARRWRRAVVVLALAGLALVAGHRGQAAGRQRGDPNSPIDLVMLQCMMPGKVRLGQSFQVRDEVENAGTSLAPESIVIYYLSQDDQLDDADVALKGRRVPPLPPGRSNSQPTSLVIEGDLPAGDYYLIAMADARRQVEETREGNNTVARKFQLLPRAQ